MSVCEIINASGTVLLSNFNASYLNSQFTSGDFSPSFFWPTNAKKPIYFNSEEGFSQLVLEVYFKNGKLSDIEALKNALKKCIITINNLFLSGSTMDCMLKSTQINKVSSKHYSVMFSFDCVLVIP